MAGLMAAHVAQGGKGAGIPADAHVEKGPIPAFGLAKFPELYGVCIYAFMCHHSLPSIISPIKDKTKVTGLFMVGDVTCVA